METVHNFSTWDKTLYEKLNATVSFVVKVAGHDKMLHLKVFFFNWIKFNPMDDDKRWTLNI